MKTDQTASIPEVQTTQAELLELVRMLPSETSLREALLHLRKGVLIRVGMEEARDQANLVTQAEVEKRVESWLGK